MKKYLYLMIIFMIGLVSCSPAYSSAALMVDPETVSTAVSTQATPTTLHCQNPILLLPYKIALR
jgi:hypothetical protein